MGKKYLDTKKNTLEDAVEQVWYQQHGLTNKETKEEQLHEVVTNYKQVAKDIKKKFQAQLKKKRFLALNDVESYVTDNADSPHKVETDEIVKELGKLGVTVAGKFPHKREEVEIEEALKTTHVLIDTSKNNEVIGAASDEKGIKQVYTDTARYTKKSVLKIVKLKKPASETKSGKLFGYPLHKWEEVEIHEQTQFQVVYTNKKSSDKGLYRLEKDRTLGKIYNQREAEKMIKKLSADKRNSDFEYRFVPKGNINRSGEVVTPVDFYKVGFKNRKEQVSSPSKYIDILNKLREETEYQKFFKSAMKKFGVKSPSELDGDKEKEFYDYVDKNWKGKNEPKEVGEKRKPNGKTLTGKPKDNIDVNPKTSDIKAGKY
jgi:hypothetical protein